MQPVVSEELRTVLLRRLDALEGIRRSFDEEYNRARRVLQDCARELRSTERQIAEIRGLTGDDNRD